MRVRDSAQPALSLNPKNGDAQTYLRAAASNLGPARCPLARQMATRQRHFRRSLRACRRRPASSRSHLRVAGTPS